VSENVNVNTGLTKLPENVKNVPIVVDVVQVQDLTNVPFVTKELISLTENVLRPAQMDLSQIKKPDLVLNVTENVILVPKKTPVPLVPLDTSCTKTNVSNHVQLVPSPLKNQPEPVKNVTPDVNLVKTLLTVTVKLVTNLSC